MLQNDIVQYCAPTLAGIKTGNIFMLRVNMTDIVKEVRKLNSMLTKKGLRLIPIRKTNTGTLIYLYRPDRLKKDLSAPKAVEIMKKKGYPCGKPEYCLATLAHRLMTDKDFPHEIGLFLGYPPSDVECFMKSPKEGVKCCGCWKAYNNEEKARKLFEKYDKCTAVYCRENQKGRSLEALTVDTIHTKPVRSKYYIL